MGKVDESRQCRELESESGGTPDENDDDDVLHMPAGVERSLNAAGGSGSDHDCDVDHN